MSKAFLMNSTSFSLKNLIHGFDYIHLALLLIAVLFIVLHSIHNIKRYLRLWRTRHLQKVWGLKNGDTVIVICSELDDPETRQNVEPREFIYNLKYGDIDAYFEVVITLLRLYPDIKLRVLSAGEAESTRIDMAQHLILIGGPDYNSFTKEILEKQITQYRYKSPDLDETSTDHPDEIVLYDSLSKKEFFEVTDQKDYGYIERIPNPNNPDSQILLFGGCHTLGVTGAVKAFSMADSEQGEISKVVLNNAKLVAKLIKKKSEFSILIPAERIGQTINVPVVNKDFICVNNKQVRK